MLLLKNVYFIQAGIGILANAFFLIFHIFTIQQVHRLRPTDITTCHLAFVHIVMLLTTLHGISEDMFQLWNFPNELKCKLLFYLSRVMRGLSISTTCLLSIIQVITISPASFCLSRFKQKLTSYIIIAFFCLWSLNLSANCYVIIYTVAHSNRSNLLNINSYCSLSSMNSIIMVLVLTLELSQSGLFVGMMLLSSMYMVVCLCSHQRKSEYLHNISISPRSSPIKRATRTVLLLVSFFVAMYCLDIIISSFTTTLWRYEPVILDIQRLVGNVYATVSPLVLISSNKRLIDLLHNVIDMITILQ
ncbi:putative vomeronasal receptor-like protein 4 [Ochotona curzoniae]|uniref:putative vomeronasal receptor-like protein 4 n=1 Tax=Ochotona curzoniae TaxID=130825 RepID=UPI001B3507C8|nr:putative vomeronasal receptor-like protein 4 [Ochotona curzoniae]